MRIELKATPSKLETLLVKFVVNDILASFFVLTLAITALVISLRLFDFKILILVVPSVALVSAIVSTARFYSYISIIFKVMGAYKKAFREFDLQEADMMVDFKPPFVLFGGGLKRYAQKTDQKPLGYVFVMRAETQKYSLEQSCQVIKGDVRMMLAVKDWHGASHERLVECKLSKLHDVSKGAIREIRQEVLEARGVNVEKIRERSREFISLPSSPPPPTQPMPVQRKEPLEELEDSLEMLDKLKSADEVPQAHEVEASESSLQARVETARTDKEKQSMQDALYQMQEIRKLLEE